MARFESSSSLIDTVQVCAGASVKAVTRRSQLSSCAALPIDAPPGPYHVTLLLPVL